MPGRIIKTSPIQGKPNHRAFLISYTPDSDSVRELFNKHIDDTLEQGDELDSFDSTLRYYSQQAVGNAFAVVSADIKNNTPSYANFEIFVVGQKIVGLGTIS